jgi:hypothetical protein
VVAGGLLLLIAWWYGGKLVSDLRGVFNRLDAERKQKEFWRTQQRWEAEAERHRLREKEENDGRIRASSGEKQETSSNRISP